MKKSIVVLILLVTSMSAYSQTSDIVFDSTVLGSGVVYQHFTHQDDKVLHYYGGYFAVNTLYMLTGSSDNWFVKYVLPPLSIMAAEVLKEFFLDTSFDAQDIVFTGAGVGFSVIRVAVKF